MINEIPEETLERLGKLAGEIEEVFNKLFTTTQSITEKHVEEYEGKWPIEKQYLKIYEETSEAQKAYERSLPNVEEEHMDILFSFLTLMHFRNPKREVTKGAILICLIKFHKRGWI